MFYVTRGSGSTPAAGMLSFPPAAGSSVQHLVDAAVPSPFGKGSETVFDPAVRTAAEIKAAQLALNKALPPPEVRGHKLYANGHHTNSTCCLALSVSGCCQLSLRNKFAANTNHCWASCILVPLQPADASWLCCCCVPLLLCDCLDPLQVLDEVRALLQPSATSVVAELDKLNIYGPGGFFKPHYDTPRSQGGWPLL